MHSRMAGSDGEVAGWNDRWLGVSWWRDPALIEARHPFTALSLSSQVARNFTHAHLGSFIMPCWYPVIERCLLCYPPPLCRGSVAALTIADSTVRENQPPRKRARAHTRKRSRHCTLLRGRRTPPGPNGSDGADSYLQPKPLSAERDRRQSLAGLANSSSEWKTPTFCPTGILLCSRARRRAPGATRTMIRDARERHDARRRGDARRRHSRGKALWKLQWGRRRMKVPPRWGIVRVRTRYLPVNTVTLSKSSWSTFKPFKNRTHFSWHYSFHISFIRLWRLNRLMIKMSETKNFLAAICKLLTVVPALNA